jgi:hypothetical protein
VTAPSPRFVVLGGPVPEALRADLFGDIELFEGGELVDPTTDGVLVHACDLDATRFGKETIFDFKRHRRIEHYGRITAQVGVTEPD